MNASNRRPLTLNSLDEVVAEIERLAAGQVRTTGKHSFPQIVRHLALTNNMMTGRISAPKIPWIMRLLMPLIRTSILKGPIKPGVKLPANAELVFWPTNEVTAQDAVRMFKDSVAYYKQHGPLPVHPIFGKATREQLDRLACNHAAMHLSFVQHH